MATQAEKRRAFKASYTATRPKGRRRPPRLKNGASRHFSEVAGPYRDESSVPSIRRKARPSEHRKVRSRKRKAAAAKSRRTKRERREAAARAALQVPDLRPERHPRVTRTRAGNEGYGSGVKPPGAEIDPGDALAGAVDAAETALGLRKPDRLTPASSASRSARAALAEEARNLYEASKESFEDLRKGRPEGLPTKKEIRAAAALAAIPGAEALPAKAAPKIAAGAEDIARSVAGRASTKAEAIRSLPTRTGSGVRRAKELPRELRDSARTSEGRKAAGRAAARKAVRHPVRSSYAAAALSPVPLPADIDKRARAFAEGTAAAVVNHPGKTLATTGEAALGAFTAPLALGGAAVESAKQGNLGPLKATGGALAKGTAHMVGELASGDPRRVEEATLKETGLTPFIPVPAIGRALRDTDAYLATRAAARGAVERQRAKTRGKRIAAEKAAQESGRFERGGKVRASVPDSERPGEHYLVRPAGRIREAQRARHGVSRAVTRMLETGNIWSRREAKRIIKELRRSPLVGKGKGENAGDVLRFAAMHGLRADEESGIAATKEALESYPKVEHGETPPGVFQDRHAAQWILDHPGLWKDKHFWKAVAIFKQGAEKVGTSERNRYLAAADNIVNPRRRREGKPPVLKPEERVPPATARLLSRLVPTRRRDSWTRSEAFDFIADLRAGIAKTERSDPQRPVLKAKARRLEKTLEGLMRPPEHGGAERGISTTRARAYTPEMLRGFIGQTQAELDRMSLDKPAAYVADVLPSGAKGAEKAPNYAGSIPARKVWPSQGKAAASGNAESSFESLLANSVFRPRMGRAVNQGLARIFDRYGYKVNGRRLLTQRQMERAINRHEIPDDVVWIRTQMLSGALTGDHPLGPEQFVNLFRGEVEHGERLASSSGAELRSELLASKAKGTKGEKYAPIQGAAARELLAQMEPLPAISKAFAKGANASTRLILNSPAFELVQFAQEGLPLLAAAGKSLRHLPIAADTLRRLRKLDPELEAQVKAVVGSSAGVQGAPTQAVLSAAGVLDPIRAAGPKRAWRHAWEVINGTKLGNFDKARAGTMRELAAAAKVEADFKAWRKGARNIFRTEQKAIEEMKGMTRQQRLAYVAAHPRLGDKLQVELNRWLGNWNSFTRIERELGPLTIFYAYQRYSLLWLLATFPLDHPVAATALAFLGAQNSNELREVAASKGARITNPIDFTQPVVVKDSGPASAENTEVLPVGRRTFPGLSSVGSAVAEDNPALITGALQPAISIAIGASEGKDSFGNPLDENGFAYAARQIVAQSPAARLLKVDEIGKPPPSTLSKAFRKLDQGSDERSVLNPYSGRSGEAYAIEARLEQALRESAANGSDAREAAARDAAEQGKVLPRKTKAEMEGKAERAQNQISAILKQLGLKAEDRRTYNLFKRGYYGTGPDHPWGTPTIVPNSRSPRRTRNPVIVPERQHRREARARRGAGSLPKTVVIP